MDSLKTPLSALSTHCKAEEQNIICQGFLDGTIQCSSFTTTRQRDSDSAEMPTKLELRWKRKMKRAIRGLQMSEDGAQIYATSSNRAICMYDTETSKRLRCIREGHKSRPNVIALLPSRIGGQQFVTGTESGEIKTWDFRQPKPNVSTFNDQEDIINSFALWKNCLLAASGDGTLAAYDLHKRKMRIQSETMHSELLSLAITDKFTYAGAADGHIEVFNNGEFGNIRERIETPFLMGVEQLVGLRNNLLLAAASTAEEMRLIHVNPNKMLGEIPHPGGVDILAKSADSASLIATGADGTNLQFFAIDQLVRDVPELKAQDMHGIKRKEKEERKLKRRQDARDGFFRDLLEDEDDDEESGSEREEDEDDDDEEEEEEDMISLEDD